MKARALALGFAHAAVDAGCAFVLFRFLGLDGRSAEAVAAWIMAYDVVAFGGQVPFGAIVDRLPSSRTAALAGVAGVIAALAAAPLAAPAAALLAGAGNALFHVGGGGYVLGQSRGRATEPGLFVGPGALGLALGILAGRGTTSPSWFIAALVLALPVVLLSIVPDRAFADEPSASGPDAPVGVAGPRSPARLLAASWLLLVAIALRSRIGDDLAAPWRGETSVVLALAGAAAAGKMLGGAVADRLGWLLSSVLALGVAAGLILGAGEDGLRPAVGFDGTGPLFACCALLMTQATTGVTFAALGMLWHRRTALAFGLGSAAVLAGVVPGWIGAAPLASSSLLVACLASGLALVIGLRPFRGREPGARIQAPGQWPAR